MAGLLFGKVIKAYLFEPVPVALAFIIGGWIILWAEKRRHNVRVESVNDVLLKDALMVGVIQCLALNAGFGGRMHRGVVQGSTAGKRPHTAQ